MNIWSEMMTQMNNNGSNLYVYNIMDNFYMDCINFIAFLFYRLYTYRYIDNLTLFNNFNLLIFLS